MARIKELIDELNQQFAGWTDFLKDEFELSETSDHKIKSKILELIFSIKEFCIKERKEPEEIISEIISENEVASILKKQVYTSMIYYRMLYPIQKLSYQDADLARITVKDIFENYILRLDYEIFERYKYIDDNIENGSKNMLSALDRLTNYYVEHLLTEKDVRRDFREETGIADDICTYYAQLYEQNFKELKLNLILNKLSVLENGLNQKPE